MADIPFEITESAEANMPASEIVGVRLDELQALEQGLVDLGASLRDAKADIAAIALQLGLQPPEEITAHDMVIAIMRQIKLLMAQAGGEDMAELKGAADRYMLSVRERADRGELPVRYREDGSMEVLVGKRPEKEADRLALLEQTRASKERAQEDRKHGRP